MVGFFSGGAGVWGDGDRGKDNYLTIYISLQLDGNTSEVTHSQTHNMRRDERQ